MTSELEPYQPDLPAQTPITEPVPAFWEHDGHKFELRGDRIVRDGCEVAVLVSPGFGAGFVTWCDGISPFEPKIVALILAGRLDMLTNPHGHEWNPLRCSRCQEFTDELEKELGVDHIYLGGAEDLVIQYVPLGTVFRIDEYDGYESIVTSSDMQYGA